jgi:hypothetical protein
MKFIEAVAKMPELCGAEDAERWGAVMQLIYEDEIKNPQSAFRKNEKDLEDPRNRLKVAFAWSCENRDKKRYCEDLVLLKMLNHYIDKHGKAELIDKRNKLMASIDERSTVFEDVNAVFTKEERMSSFWDY